MNRIRTWWKARERRRRVDEALKELQDETPRRPDWNAPQLPGYWMKPRPRRRSRSRR